jgi:hypothetical protein
VGLPYDIDKRARKKKAKASEAELGGEKAPHNDDSLFA